MSIRLLSGAVALALLGACNAAPEQPAKRAPKANTADTIELNAATGAAQPSRDGSLKSWLVGTWSFEDNCGSDFLVHYKPDGTVENSGDTGTWKVDGETVTEVITDRFNNGEGATKLDPPESRTYSVIRQGDGRGVLNYNRRSVPIVRC